MHVCKVSSQIRDDTFCLNLIFAKERLFLMKSIIKAESVIPDEPVQTAQANLG
jgi:hypothetical protein